MKQEEIRHKDYRWINITEPDQDMVAFLRQEFNFHPLALEDTVSRFQYPKIDAYDDYLFLILQFPMFETERGIYKRLELDIFVGKDYFVTIHNGELKPVQKLFEKNKNSEGAREKYMDKGIPLLLYETVDLMFDNVFPVINDKYDTIFQLEDDIFSKQDAETKDVIQEIMMLKRDLINLWRIIVPQRQVLTDIEIKYKKFIPQELDIYFDDIVDKIDKMKSQLDTAQAYADVLEDANETIISRNTNKVIKILTIFSVVMLPLTLVTSYYGMNVALPFQNDPNAVNYINLIMIGLVALMFGFFIKKRWL